MATRKTGGAGARLGGARKRVGDKRASLGNPSLRQTKGSTSKPGLRKAKGKSAGAKMLSSGTKYGAPSVSRKRRSAVAKYKRGY